MRFFMAMMTSVRWAFNTRSWHPSAVEWAKCARCIQLEEKERIGKFMFKRDAKSSMIGRLMLRTMIHQVTKIPYVDVELGRTEKGKPYLMNSVPDEYRKFSFNVSHHGDFVVLAAESDAQVGIDVMKLETPFGAKTVSEFFHTMRRQFTDEEMKCIRSGLTENDQLSTFYRFWCLKESYVKALGVGIGYEVQLLNFTLTNAIPDNGTVVTSTSLRINDEHVEGWTFEETQIDNHCIAVAVEKPKLNYEVSDNSKFRILSFEEMISDCSFLSDVDDEYGEQFMQRDESPLTMKNAKLHS